LAAAGLAVAAGLALMVNPAAGAPVPAETPTSGIAITLATTTQVLTAEDAVLRIEGTVTNATDSAIEGDINLRIALDPFESLEELEAWAAPGAPDLEEATFRVKALGAQRLEPGATANFTLEVPAAELNLGNRGNEPGWGPRGLAVDFDTAEVGSVAEARDYVIYAPPGAVRAAVRVTVAAPLVQAAGETPAQAAARVRQVVTATPAATVSWFIDPALLDAEATTGGAGQHPLADAVMAGLTAGKTIYSLPYGDLDLVAMAQVQPQPAKLLTVAQSLGATALQDALGPAAANIRTDTALTTQPLNQAALAFLATAGLSQAVVPASQLAHAKLEPGRTVQVTAQDRSLSVLVPGGYIEELLTATETAELNRVTVALAFMAAQSQAEGNPVAMVALMPRNWTPAEGTAEWLNALATLPWVTLTGLPAALTAPAAGAVEAVPDDDVTAGANPVTLAGLSTLADEAYAFAALTDDPAAYVAEIVPALLKPWSATNAPGEARQLAVDVATNVAREKTPDLAVVVGSEVNMISADGRIPITVLNNSDVRVSGLVVSLKPSTSALRVAESATVEIEPGGTVTARIPVHAVANGTFDVAVELANSAGQAVAQPATLTMRVRAEWEDWVTAVFSVGLALVMLYGVITTVRKRRAQALARRQVKALLGAAGEAGMAGVAGVAEAAETAETAAAQPVEAASGSADEPAAQAEPADAASGTEAVDPQEAAGSP
jgi:hypothetical protein